jgi:hypothetical protein
MSQELASYARNWVIPPRIAPCTKRQEREPKLHQEDAMDAMRWGTWLIGVLTSKISIKHIKAAYAILVEERGI